MELFNDPDLNSILAAAQMFPMTTSKDNSPALGLVIDWDADGNIYQVVEVPFIISCPN